MRSDLHGRFTKIFLSSFIQMFFAQGTTFLVNIITARLFGPSTFGLFSVSIQTLNAVGQTAQLATGSVGSRFLGQWYGSDPKKALAGWFFCRRIGLISGVFVSALFFILAPWTATYVFRQPPLTDSLHIISLAAFLFVASQQTIQGLAAVEAVKSVSLISVLSGLFYVGATLLGAHYGGFTLAVVGITVSYGFQALLCWWTERRILGSPAHHRVIKKADAEKPSESPSGATLSSEAPPPDTRTEDARDFSQDFARLKHQLIPASLSGLLLLPSTWLLIVLITAFAGSKEAGIYAAATQLRLLLMMLPQILNSAGLVIINRAALTQQKKKADALATWTLLGSALFCMLLGYACSFAIPLVLGPKFAASIEVFHYLLPAIFLESVVLLGRQRLQSEGNFWGWLVGITLPWQTVSFLCAWLTIPTLGAKGAAISYSIGLICGIAGYCCLNSFSRKPPIHDLTSFQESH